MNRCKNRGPSRPLYLLFLLIGAIPFIPDGNAAAADVAQAENRCVAPATWLRVEDRRVLGNGEILKYLAGQQAILLGEHHDDPDHHRWQMQVIAGLYALRQDLILGFEMFPRETQPVLDEWVAGRLSEAEFLKRSDWYGNWSFDPDLYMPIFEFARLNRIPMIALNVNRALFDEVQEKGWAAIPRERRQGITDPAPATKAYLEMLASSFMQHHAGPHGHDEKFPQQFSMGEKQAFERFVEGQQLWDRAMAQAVADAARRKPAPLLIGIMGSGHLVSGFGVPSQLTALGVKKNLALIPWDEELSCEDLVPGFAYAVFGLQAPVAALAQDKPRLGVYLEPAAQGVKVVKLVENSIAAASGIAVDDRLVEAAGAAVRNMNDVIDAVQRMAPGTWLPLTVMRGDKRIEIVAKFPAKAQ